MRGNLIIQLINHYLQALNYIRKKYWLELKLDSYVEKSMKKGFNSYLWTLHIQKNFPPGGRPTQPPRPPSTCGA